MSRLLPAIAALIALAAPAPAQTNEDCLACHADAALTRANGTPVAVEAAVLAASLHGEMGLSCVDCHSSLAGVEDQPHAEALPPAECSACHADAATAWQGSVHAEGRTARCSSCHGAHDIQPVADPASPAFHLNVVKTCSACHARGGVLGPQRAGIPAAYADSIHGRAVTGGREEAPTCVTCHGAHAVKNPEDPLSAVARANVPQTCGTCHSGVLEEWTPSVHAASVQAGGRGAVCTSCHSAHGIDPASVPGWRLDVVSECGTCHEESLRTYRDGFHGKVSALGFERVATCADCHGAHGIVATEDPSSRVAPGNLVATCGRCHPGANASFVKFDPHADVHDREVAPVYWTARFMQLLLAGVFTFFFVHTALWFPRELRLRRERRQGEGSATPEEGA